MLTAGARKSIAFRGRLFNFFPPAVKELIHNPQDLIMALSHS